MEWSRSRVIRTQGGGRRSGRGGGVPAVVLLLAVLVGLLAPLTMVRPAAVAAQDTVPTDDPALMQEPAIVPVDPYAVPNDPNALQVDPNAVSVNPNTLPAAEPAVVVRDAAPSLVPPPLAPAPGPDPNWSPPVTVYVAETGQTLDRLFLDMWRGWGGANSFGYPLTPEFEEDGRIVQYLGYGRFEYWPEDPDNPVRLGDIGDELRPRLLRRTLPGSSALTAAAALEARAWLPLAADDARADSDEYLYIPEAQHSVAGGFKWLWENTGAETYLGYPLTEEYTLHGTTYQVFERGQMAWEPGGDPYLMPVGALLATRKGLDTAPVAQGDLPAYSEELFVPPPAPVVVAAPTVDPNAPRSLEVSIAQQYAWARQGDVVLWEGFVSTGKEGFETPTGTFFVNSKIPVQNMEGVIGGEYYNVPSVPDVMYFTNVGHAIHGTYWHNNFGVPMSHGCINLPVEVASWMYGWAPIGMQVTINP